MNNFELFRRATLLADTESAYQLAKRVVELEKALSALLPAAISDYKQWTSSDPMLDEDIRYASELLNNTTHQSL